MGCRVLPEKSSGFKCFACVANYTFGGQRLSIFGYCSTSGLRHYLLTNEWQMSPEEKYILLMEAAYTTEDKNTYYKLMQKADQVLKDTQATADSMDAEAAEGAPMLSSNFLPCQSQIALGIALSVGQLYANPAYRIDLSDHFLLSSSR